MGRLTPAPQFSLRDLVGSFLTDATTRIRMVVQRSGTVELIDEEPEASADGTAVTFGLHLDEIGFVDLTVTRREQGRDDDNQDPPTSSGTDPVTGQ